MRTLIAAFALPVLALAACDRPPQDPEPLDPAPLPDEAAAASPAVGVAGAYDVAMADGSERRQVLYDDGRYADTDMAGAQVESGTWRIEGEAYCFDPEGESPETCYNAGTYFEDGTFEKLLPGGEVYAILRSIDPGANNPAGLKR